MERIKNPSIMELDVRINTHIITNLLLCGFLLSSTFFMFSSVLRFHSLQLHSGYGSCARMGPCVARRSTGTIPAVHTS